jgi:SAM-dependent methyltransferase
MHASAYQNLQSFNNRYCKHLTTESIVLEFGSCQIDGSAKPIFAKSKYIGVDIIEGPNVDMIFNDYKLDLPDNYADAIVSSSCFEHDEMFWLTFLEMCRLIKPNEYFYICAPSEGHYHPFPGDCYRFYKDSWKALEKWGQRNNYPVKLIKGYIDLKDDHWKDSIGIFQKTC